MIDRHGPYLAFRDVRAGDDREAGLSGTYVRVRPRAAATSAIPRSCQGLFGAETWPHEAFSDAGAVCALHDTPAVATGPDEQARIVLDADLDDPKLRLHLVAIERARVENGVVMTCHACSGYLDLYVYGWDGKTWRSVAEVSEIGGPGRWGHGPTVSVIALGPKRSGLEVLIRMDSNGGLESDVDALYALFPSEGDRLELREIATAGREVGECNAWPDRPCHEVDEHLRMSQGIDPEWFDLLVEHTERSGPGVPLDAEGEPSQDRPLLTTTRTIRHVFRDGRYVEAASDATQPSP
jgi:hypothetical protein